MNLIYSIVTTLLINLSLTGCADASGQGTEAVDLRNRQQGTEVATFAGGCFWCTEAVFERVIGVKDVVSGYTGGPQENPTYKQVSYGETDHLEAVQIYYDPKIITYQELLEIFFEAHYPTQANGQGPDIGAQYLAAIFYHNEEQKRTATDYIDKLSKSGKYTKKIVTGVREYEKFWLAEKYHQNYYELNHGNPYIINIAVPKVKKFKKLFPDKVKAEYRSEAN